MPSFKRFLAAALCMISSPAARAADAELLRFRSGLRVALLPMEAAPRISAAMVVDAGYVDEAAGQEGAAHLLEHLWFRSGEVSAEARLSSAGCGSNAFTHPDRTEFLAACPPEALELLLDLEAQRLADPLAGIDAAALRVEILVLEQEMAERRDWRLHPVMTQVDAMLYPRDNPLVLRQAREPESYEHLDLEILRAFAGERYRAAGSTLALVGRFDAQQVRQLLQERFGPLDDQAGPRARRVPWAAPRRTLRPAPRTVQADVGHPVMVLAWPLPHEAASGLERQVITGILQRVVGGRYRNWPAVISVDCQAPITTYSSSISCVLDLQDEAPLEELALDLRGAAAGLWSGASARHVRKFFEPARSQAAISLATAQDLLLPVSSGAASLVAHQLFFLDAADFFGLQRQRLRSARAADMLEQARHYLDPQQALVLVVEPQEEEPVRALAFNAAEALPLERPAPGGAALNPSRPLLAERRLDNGMRLLALQRQDLHAAYAGLRLRRPASQDCDLASDLADWNSHGPQDEDLLQDLLLGSGREASGLVTTAVAEPGELKSMLQELRRAVAEREPMVQHRLAWFARQRSMQRRLEEDPRYWAQVLPALAVDGGGQLRCQVSGQSLVAMLGASEAQQEQAIAARCRPALAELTVMAPQPAVELLDAAEKVFASWEEPGDPLPAPPEARQTLPAPQLFLLEDSDHAQASLSWHCGLQRAEPAALMLLEEALRQELLRSLRLRRGAVYAPQVSVESNATGEPWLSVQLLSSPEAMGMLLDGLEAQVGSLGTMEPGILAELARGLAQQRAVDRDAPPIALQLALGTHSLHHPDFVASLSSDLGEQTPQDLGAALQGCLQSSAAGIAGPLDPIRGALDESERSYQVIEPQQALEDLRAQLGE